MSRRFRLVLDGLGHFGLGAIMLALAVHMHEKLSPIEAAGNVPRMGNELKAVYMLTGKWGVVGLITAAGVVFLIMGAHRARRNARKWLRPA